MNRYRAGAVVCMGDISPDVIIPYGYMRRSLCKLHDGIGMDTCKPSMRAGGSIGSTALVLGKLGISPYLLARVSADVYGDYLLQALKENGVDTEFVTRQAQAQTIFLAVLDECGERTLFDFNGPGACMPQLQREHLPNAFIPHIGWLHANGFANEAMVDYMQSCARAGAVVSFDLNLRIEQHGFDAARERLIRRAVDASDVIFGSGIEEFYPLTGLRNLRASAHALSDSRRLVVARDGCNPVYVVDAQGCQSVPVQKCAPVNTTNSGDIFNAGFIAGAVRGKDAVSAARWGAACAAHAISSPLPYCIPDADALKKL
ncbi:MAG: carbohydrate kinase family protein [Oscillospiraceae bacterium]|nr:carbohydrate kinase family protein [Oscillospiraceae bacterium]